MIISGVEISSSPGMRTQVARSSFDIPPYLWTMGNNTSGELGNNTQIPKSIPTIISAGSSIWQSVSMSGDRTAAIKTDGTLWLWGGQQFGELGNNTIPDQSQSSPVQTAAGGTNWRQISIFSNNSSAIKTDGTLWTWGYNSYGQLGDNTGGNGTYKSSPVQTISGGSNWRQVSQGTGFVGAIKTDGTLWTWGRNYFTGCLGDNTQTPRSSPVQTIAGGTNWRQVSAGGTTCSAIKTDGTLWTWGNNYEGQLGDNQTIFTRRSSPVQTISSGTNWANVSAGINWVTAIKTDGTLWTWGNNQNGKLGDNSIIKKSSPVQTAAGGTNWRQVFAGQGNHTAAIKTDGTLWMWGSNYYGQLGNNDNGSAANRSSPVQTVIGGTNWLSAATGGNHTAAISSIITYAE